ncbi:MAG: RNA pseudouridine synthase [Clostridia bacterium]|nr:RNA pseudouridine synthase [Clostridia bacterium]
MLKVIYEDNHLLVCEKPVNMPVQADATGDPDLLTEAKEYIKRKYNKPGDVYLGLVHRLDRPVGGVMVFARTSKAAARLTDAIKARRVRKRYAAVLTRCPAPYGHLVNHIVKDEITHSARLVSEDTPGAQTAKLDYSVVCEKHDLALVDVDLQTGRHHQIRAQFAGIGCPLYGDQRYNPVAKPGQQIALHAYSLTLEHPTLHESMTFTSIPHGASWSSFDEELKALASGVRVSYVDENVIAVNKSADIACAIADGAEDTIEARLDCAFGSVLPVHRLDVPTTGLVLFARNERAYEELSALIRGRAIKKYYHTRVFGVPEPREATLRLYAEKDADKSTVRVFDTPTPAGKEMLTAYRVLSTDRGGRSGAPATSLIEIELKTGRTHQIRASLAHIGCPVVGDDKYGDRVKNKLMPKGLQLCAVRIVFPGDMQVLSNLNGKTLEAAAPFEWN